MTRIRSLEHEFLRFQVGQMLEYRVVHFGYPSAPENSTTWFFHLRGFGATREAALAMAGISSAISLQEEIY